MPNPTPHVRLEANRQTLTTACEAGMAGLAMGAAELEATVLGAVALANAAEGLLTFARPGIDPVVVPLQRLAALQGARDALLEDAGDLITVVEDPAAG